MSVPKSNILYRIQMIRRKYDSWDKDEPYKRGKVVLYHDALFESLIDDNLGNNPISSTYWRSIL